MTNDSKAVEDLVSAFEEACLAQDQYVFPVNARRYNKLYSEMRAIEEELKDRNAREVLATLYNHKNAQVRLQAAGATLGLLPGPARKTLQRIIDRDEYPQAGDARGFLAAMDSGKFKSD